jgi:hypothetical protein
MGADKASDNSKLFLIRIWQEGEEGGLSAWRGRVLHVTSGKASSFREWPELVALLTDVLSSISTERPGRGTALRAGAIDGGEDNVNY